MKTTTLENLKIHKLSRAQYQHLIDTDQIDETALYMVPEETVDLSSFATTEEMEAAIAAIPQTDWEQVNTSAADYIKNKPFGLVPVVDPIVWDDPLSGEQVTVPGVDIPFYKVADYYIPVEYKSGFNLKATINGANYTLDCLETQITVPDKMVLFAFANMDIQFLVYILSISAGTEYSGVTYNSDITYGYPALMSEGTIESITLNVNELKQLDPKFYKNFPGERTKGEVFVIDGQEVTAEPGAEIFNSYGDELTGEPRNIATGSHSHAEGMETTASGRISHAEGEKTIASGECSHAEGFNTTASGKRAHAEGTGSVASGQYSHAEGASTASGDYSHAEGSVTVASGRYAHAEGWTTIASGAYQHVQGKNNIEDSSLAHIVGGGYSNQKLNIHTLDWNGNAWFQGDIYVGSTAGLNKDEGSKKLATVDEISEQIAAARKVYYAIEADNYGGDIYVNIDNFESYELDAIIFLQFGFDQKSKISTINVNGLGAIPLLSVTTFNTAHTYDVIPKEKDTFVVIYDKYQHFTLLGHLNKDTSYDDLTDDVKSLLVPAVTASNAGQFARVSADGKWTVETVEIPSIDGLAATTYVDTQDAATLQGANTYTDEKIANLLNNSTEAVDSVMELAAAMETNKDAIDALTEISGNKVDKVEGKGLSTNDYTDDDAEKLAGIEVGAQVNVQSDWCEVDTESSAYIHNRPFYENITYENLYIITNLTFSDYSVNEETGQAIYAHLFSDASFVLEEGATYIVEWPSFSTECVGVRVNETTVAVGNYALMDPASQSDSGESFYIATDTSGACTVLCTLADSIAEIPILKVLSEVQQLDEKFIPDTIARTSDLPQITTEHLIMSAANWNVEAKTYSFEDMYPAAEYDIELDIDGDVITVEQLDAFNGARMVSSATTNMVKAFGEVPTVDIPVILKVQVK